MSLASFLPGVDTLVNLWNNERNINFQRNVNEQNIDMARETNAANAALQRQNSIDQQTMWAEQTRYNAPAAQMQRLQDAGLNPNLVYGSIAESKMSAPPSTSPARFDAPHADAPHSDFVNPLARYQQVKNLQAMNEVQNANIRRIKTEADNAVLDNEYKKYELQMLKNSGTLRSDNSLLKGVMRAGDLVYQSGKYWGGKTLELNSAIADKLWNTGRWVLQKVKPD